MERSITGVKMPVKIITPGATANQQAVDNHDACNLQ